ncbi:uncharacterized protein hhla1 isoform X2 [Larimichthys crocea]|uniref:uncharacterized protein hhla1 isoform X2 n=1 Tax=Larimichthys crocea TaxID=215358 RepID=UPI000F5E6FA3|nr:HERV-H LTR-associating protein 1 isoform X2 [Larimichthys crocea]
MACLQRAMQHPRLCVTFCVSTMLLLIVFSQAFRDRRQDERHKRDIVDSTEIPAEHIDPAAIDLTPLVNTLINTSQSVSSIKNLESSTFRRRFCYCVTNETNDLTDFTAILLDVMGNSTSYLHELFKSASILSVSQRNNSDCIYICVMAGKMGREVSELWEFDSITPLYNQTIVEGPHRVGNLSSIRLPDDWHHLPTNLSHIAPSGMSSMLTSRVHSTAHVSPTGVDETVAITAKITTARPPATSRQPTTVMSQSQTTAGGRPHATTKAAEKTATMISQPIISTQPATTLRVTTASVTTAAAPTTARPRTTRLTTASTKATTSSPVLSLTRLTTATTRQLTVHPTAGPTGPLSRRPTTSNTPVEQPGCPWRRPELTDASFSGSTTTVSAHKLQPCVLELCKFFAQCICRPFGRKARKKRYCDNSQVWYEKHTSEVCRRVRRISFSRNLKQRCLTKMCNKL